MSLKSKSLLLGGDIKYVHFSFSLLVGVNIKSVLSVLNIP